MIAPLGPLLTALLTALSAGRRRAGVRGRVSRFGGGAGLGLSAEELLLAEAQQRLKPVDFGLELRLAFEGAAMHGPPVGGLPPGLELLLQAWANRAGALRDRRSGADRTGRRLGRSAAVRSRSSSETVTRVGVKQKMEAEPSSIRAESNHLPSGRREPTTGLPNAYAQRSVSLWRSSGSQFGAEISSPWIVRSLNSRRTPPGSLEAH